MDRTLVKDFWACGDNQIIEFAMVRARLNRQEKEALTAMLDNCMTQEKAAEYMDISTRKLQEIWYTAADKLLQIGWVSAYAKELRVKSENRHITD